MFTEKLKAIGQELDLAVAARIAKVVVEQFEIRSQKQRQLKEMEYDGGYGYSVELEAELNHRENLV